MTPERFDQLLAELLDGGLTPAEGDELLENAVAHPALGQRLIELLRLEPLLVDHAHADQSGEGFVRRVQQAIEQQPSIEHFTSAVLQKLQRRNMQAARGSGAGRGRPTTTGNRIKRGWVLAAVAAGLLLALGAVWYWQQLPSEDPPAFVGVARLEAVTGEVHLAVDGELLLAKTGLEIGIGQQVHTLSDDSSAVVVFPDGTRLELGANTIVRLDTDNVDAAACKIFVAEGVLVAEVAQKQADRPTVITTPLAEVIIQQTRFSLASASTWMHIALECGTVEVKRFSDGKSIQLQAGQYAMMTAENEMFEPQPQPPRLWTPHATFSGHSDKVEAVAFSPDGKLLASASFDGTVKLWDLADKRLKETFGDKALRCIHAAFSPDAPIVAAVFAGKKGKKFDTVVQLWNWQTRHKLTSFPAAETSPIAVLFSPDGATLAAVDEKRNIHLWDSASRQRKQTLRMPKGRILALGFAPDGQKLQAINEYGTLNTWELPAGRLLSNRQLVAYESEKECAAFSADGKLFATGTKQAAVQVWDTATGKRLATLHGHRGRILSVAFAPQGTLLATGSRDQTARLWDLTTAKELATLEGQRGYVNAVRFSGDGKTLAIAGNDGSVRLWNVDIDALLQGEAK